MPNSIISTGDIGITYQGLDITKQVLTSNGSFQSRSARKLNDRISETLKSKNSFKTQKDRHDFQNRLQAHRISILKNHSLSTAKDIARTADETVFKSNNSGKLSFERCQRLQDSIKNILSITESFEKIDIKNSETKKIKPIINVKKFQKNVLQDDLTLFIEKVIKESKTVSGLESIRVELAFLNQEGNLTRKQYKHLHKSMAIQYNKHLTEILTNQSLEGYEEHLEKLKALHALTTSLSNFDKKLLKQWHQSLKQKSLMLFAYSSNSLSPSETDLQITIQQQANIKNNKEEYLRPILEKTSKHFEKRLSQADESIQEILADHQYAIDRPHELLKTMDKANNKAAKLQTQIFQLTQKSLEHEKNLESELNHYKKLKQVAITKFLGRIGPKYLAARQKSRTLQEKLINQLKTTHKDLKDVQDRYDAASTEHANKVSELRGLYQKYGNTITASNGKKSLTSHHLNRLNEICDLEMANNCLKLWTKNLPSDVVLEVQELLVDLIKSGEYSPQRALTLFGTAFIDTLGQTTEAKLSSRIEALKTRIAKSRVTAQGKKIPCINFAPLSQKAIESGKSYADYLRKRLSGSLLSSQPAQGQQIKQQDEVLAQSVDPVRPSEPLYYSGSLGVVTYEPAINKLQKREDFTDADRQCLLDDIQQSNLPEESKPEFADYVSDSALETSKGNRYSFQTIHKAVRKTLNDFNEGHGDIWSNFNKYLVNIAQVTTIDETPLDELSPSTPEIATNVTDATPRTSVEVITDQHQYNPADKLAEPVVESDHTVPFPPAAPPPPPPLAHPQSVKSPVTQTNGRQDLLREIRMKGGKVGKKKYKKPTNPAPVRPSATGDAKKGGVDLFNSPLLQRIDKEQAQEKERESPKVPDLMTHLVTKLNARRKGINGN